MGSVSGTPAADLVSDVVAIVGATGTGKSALSLDIAEALSERGRQAEIVNADAMQLYRGMDIGTAKLPESQRRGIAHHLIDVLEPREETSVAAYQVAAREAIDSILERGNVPLLVGGSGLYVSSVIYDFQFPGTDPVIRSRLEAELDTEGSAILARRLSAIDPEAAKAIGQHNGRRIVRALEVIELTGKPFGSGLGAEQTRWRPTTVLGLRAERAELIPRLDSRVQAMWAEGLVDEVRVLEPGGFGVTAARAIGYAQALAQLHGEFSEAEAIEQSAALTRKYARRQVSWFGRSAQTNWLRFDDPARVDAAMALLLTHG